MVYYTVTGVSSKQAVPILFFCLGWGCGVGCGAAFVSFLSKVCSFIQKGGRLPVDFFVLMSDFSPFFKCFKIIFFFYFCGDMIT